MTADAIVQGSYEVARVALAVACAAGASAVAAVAVVGCILLAMRILDELL